MKIQQYDRILLKYGREGTAVEVYGNNEEFIVDIGSSPKDWDTMFVKYDEIEKVVWSESWENGRDS